MGSNPNPIYKNIGEENIKHILNQQNKEAISEVQGITKVDRNLCTS